MATAFGDLVRRLRKANRITLKQLADVAGISVSMLSEVERGERRPFPDRNGSYHRVAEMIGADLDELTAAAIRGKKSLQIESDQMEQPAFNTLAKMFRGANDGSLTSTQIEQIDAILDRQSRKE